MALEIHNQGPGNFGKPSADWRMALPASSYRFNMGSGSVGSVDFTTDCDWTVRFSIDNYLSIRHYLDDDTNTLGLATFDARITDITTNGETASITGVSPIAALNRDLDVPLMAAGTYLRSFTLPVNEPYVLNGVNYRTGGDFVTIDGVVTFVEATRTIYDMDAFANRVYILAEGGAPVNTADAQQTHAVVYEHYADGTFIRVWPVYSDATDLGSATQPSAIAVGHFDAVYNPAAPGWPGIYVGQTHATNTRVKYFDNVGNFVAQWGSTGVGAGQFNQISGISATHSTAYNSNYQVADESLDRVQAIDRDDGSVEGTWTGINGAQALVFSEGMLIVGDYDGYVRGYGAEPLNTYYGQVAGPDLLDAGYAMSLGLDSLGNIYVLQNGHVYMFAKVNKTFGTNTVFKHVKTWDGPKGSGHVGAVDKYGGTLFFLGEYGVIHTYATIPTTLETIISYYVGLAAPGTKISISDLNNPRPAYEDPNDINAGPFNDSKWAIASWSGNVWDRLNELCAITENEVFIVGDTVMVRPRGDRSFPLPKGSLVSPLNVSSARQPARVEAVSLNSRWVNYTSLDKSSEYPLYEAQEDNRVFTCDVGSYEVHVVEINGDATVVTHVDPGNTIRAADVLTEGSGLILRSGKFFMWEFEEAGGKVEAWPGVKPGTIEIAITGPGQPLVAPNYLTGNIFPVPGPYEFRYWESDQSDFTVWGQGVRGNPTIVGFETGVPELKTGMATVSLESPFFVDEELATTEVAKVVYANTPSQRVTVTVPYSGIPNLQTSGVRTYGSHSFMNARFYYRESEYIVIEVEQSSDGLVLIGESYNVSEHSDASEGIDLEGMYVSGVKRFNEVWNASTASVFEQYWSGYNSGEFELAPLLNPFGYNTN